MRNYAGAIKAADKNNTAAQKNSIAHQALEGIAKFYEEDGKLKDLPPWERLQKQKLIIKPLVEDSFACVKEIHSDTMVLPKGKTADGLKYSLNQEKTYKYFLIILISRSIIQLQSAPSECFVWARRTGCSITL